MLCYVAESAGLQPKNFCCIAIKMIPRKIQYSYKLLYEKMPRSSWNTCRFYFLLLFLILLLHLYCYYIQIILFEIIILLFFCQSSDKSFMLYVRSVGLQEFIMKKMHFVYSLSNVAFFIRVKKKMLHETIFNHFKDNFKIHAIWQWLKTRIRMFYKALFCVSSNFWLL